MKWSYTITIIKCGKTSEFSPPNERSKEGFFLWGLYRKVGHGLLGGK